MAKGKKVISLLQFPEGDPRNKMTDEEIARIAALEEAELDRILSKAPPLSQIASGGVEEEEDEEDEEDFKVDLSKGVVTQTVAQGIILGNGAEKEKLICEPLLVEGGYIKLAGTTTFNDQPIAVVTPDMEYMKMLTDVLVSQGIRYARRKIESDWEALDKAKQASRITTIYDMLNGELEKLEEKRIQLRKALPIEGLGDGAVRYENIPDWASNDVKIYVRNAMRQLLTLIDDEQI